jgi:DNA polymerase-1
MHIDKEGSVINISSKKQLGEIVFDYMNIEPVSKTDKGSPQFNDTMIQKLEELGNDWARKLGNYNKLVKIKGAYIDRFLDAEENGIFYPSFFQHRTISGRYGSDMQQLPRPKEEGELDPIVLQYTNIIRKFFISGEGRMFVDNDYESLEPHVFAHVSGDEGLRDIFRKGHDFYSTIAIATEGLEGVSADKKAENYLGKVNKPLRQKAKAYSLGVPYGMKGFALGKTLGIETEEADELIANYLNGFPELKKWMKESEEKAQHLGYVESEVGRKRHLPEVKRLHTIYGTKLLDFKYRPKLVKKFGKEKVMNMYRDYKNGLNNAKNVQIQSLASSI